MSSSTTLAIAAALLLIAAVSIAIAIASVAGWIQASRSGQAEVVQAARGRLLKAAAFGSAALVAALLAGLGIVWP